MAKDWQDLTIAEKTEFLCRAIGWKLKVTSGEFGSYHWIHKHLGETEIAFKREAAWNVLPNVVYDLNVMHRIEEHCLFDQPAYKKLLKAIAGKNYWIASCEQRAEAFYKYLTQK